VQHVRRGNGVVWPDLALDLGFYDQAHLARDVRRFTGVTPTEARGMVSDLAGLLA
jgi:transcriptional regulator GlxA family with amidase domain